MSDAMTIHVPPSEQASVSSFISRLESELGQSTDDAIAWAAYYIARSARASTKSASSKRRLLKNRGAVKQFSATAFPHYVKIWKRGKFQPYYIPAGEETDHPARAIHRAGLAKDSWSWMIRDLAKRAPRTKNRRRGGMSRAIRRGGLDPMVILENNLSYIERAIRLGGKRGIDTAVERGMRAGFRYLERRTKKAIS